MTFTKQAIDDVIGETVPFPIAFKRMQGIEITGKGERDQTCFSGQLYRVSTDRIVDSHDSPVHVRYDLFVAHCEVDSLDLVLVRFVSDEDWGTNGSTTAAVEILSDGKRIRCSAETYSNSRYHTHADDVIEIFRAEGLDFNATSNARNRYDLSVDQAVSLTNRIVATMGDKMHAAMQWSSLSPTYVRF